jgi:hypothetical protein
VYVLCVYVCVFVRGLRCCSDFVLAIGDDDSDEDMFTMLHVLLGDDTASREVSPLLEPGEPRAYAHLPHDHVLSPRAPDADDVMMLAVGSPTVRHKGVVDVVLSGPDVAAETHQRRVAVHVGADASLAVALPCRVTVDVVVLFCAVLFGSLVLVE